VIRIIDGRKRAESVHAETEQRVHALVQRGTTPKLLFARVGEDPASKVYVGMKEKMCSRLGIQSETIILPESTSETELLAQIEKWNCDSGLHGILIQAPLPAHINESTVFAHVSPEKDVDGFHPVNVGKLVLGDPTGFIPCTPGGVIELLKAENIETRGADVVVLGRGAIVGKPMAALLTLKSPTGNATVTVCHSHTRDIAEKCRAADIIIAAIGSPEFVKADMVKPGAVIIDVGVNRVSDPTAKGGSRLVGDVDFEGVKELAGAITPNPGGVGPMTIAMLMKNTVLAAERQASDRLAG
jgi:methylenetetrahydrofolate dehydrogenase (NADP+)/methenyltetrahydrofolate cyclohydrolase